jgi:molecular chaperone DnaJ
LTADGDDLVCQVPLRFSQAAMGTRVSVPTLEGIETLTLPAGVTTGTTIRIAGRGLPGVTVDRRGALRVVVQVDAAAVISAAHGAVLTAFEAALPAGAFARVSAYEQALTSLPQADAETTAPRTETSSA